MRLSVILSVLALSAAAPLSSGMGAEASGPARDSIGQDKQSYCINDKADFYPYEDGQICRKGYQLAGGNCRLQDGRMIAVSKADCARMAGDVALPTPAARLTGETDKNAQPKPKPLTVQNPKP